MHGSGRPEQETSATARSARAAGTGLVRVMTWNIHNGVGLGRRRDLDRVAALVERHDPDILALQEVGSRTRMRAPGGTFRTLAERLGPHATESRLVTAPDGDYGHMLISRWPIVTSACHDISFPRREPRAVIAAVTRTPFGPLNVLSAHLGLSLRERHHQADLLTDLAMKAGGPAVMLGDFNDWIFWGRVQNALARAMPGRSRIPSFPALLPLLPLDRIYCRPEGLLRKSWTDRRAVMASDHLPVIADLDMGAA